MSLAETQAALARLFTQNAARAEFARNPAAAAKALAGLDAEEVARFASGLFAKRRLDVEKWLPQTAKALGPEFGRWVRGSLREPPPGSRADALALVAKLRSTKSPPWIGALAAYEGEFVRAWGPHGYFAVRLFRWSPTGLQTRRALTLAIWLRPRGGRLWHRRWTL